MNKKIGFLILGCLVSVFLLLGYWGLRYQGTSATRLEDTYGSTIEQQHSQVDYNQNGIDDQMDLLQGALDYIATRPKYKSKYYTTGYPDDGYGVCTDVVAFAMKNAGYNLMELVARDIQDNKKAYDIEEADINIDFRRVRNLKVYFEHTAISLTTDIKDIQEWQGGDIVIFKNHIGILSDHRNKDGVPYVIHHNDPMQKAYEEDILETRDDIEGHYRISE